MHSRQHLSQDYFAFERGTYVNIFIKNYFSPAINRLNFSMYFSRRASVGGFIIPKNVLWGEQWRQNFALNFLFTMRVSSVTAGLWNSKINIFQSKYGCIKLLATTLFEPVLHSFHEGWIEKNFTNSNVINSF